MITSRDETLPGCESLAGQSVSSRPMALRMVVHRVVCAWTPCVVVPLRSDDSSCPLDGGESDRRAAGYQG